MKKSLIFLFGFTLILPADFTRLDGMVSDSTTHLQWQDYYTANSDNSIEWQGAINYCEALQLGGHDDWRLPNINELKTIVDRSRYDPAIVDAFENVHTNGYWSATTRQSDRQQAWYVDFKHGRVYHGSKDGIDRVRCVRVDK